MSTEFPDERLELLFVSAHLAVASATHKPFMLQITDPRQGNWVRATRCYLRGLRDRLGSHTCYNSREKLRRQKLTIGLSDSSKTRRCESSSCKNNADFFCPCRNHPRSTVTHIELA